MQDEGTKDQVRELVRQIQEKSLQLSDLDVILEDYSHERSQLLREIGRLKAALWELVGDAPVRPSSTAQDMGAADEVKAE